MTKEPFRICLTMAGAVSAGAYTAGVIDYLLETLKLWENLKNTDNESIPNHEVKLEVISGASAGGIVGTLMVASLLDGNFQKLRDAWVGMADEKGKYTLSKMLNTKDIQKNNKVRSLLNSTPLEYIADEMLNIQKIGSYPNYVSKHLDLILTVSNLRGLPSAIEFKMK